MAKVTITQWDIKKGVTTMATFTNVVKISEGKSNLIIYFKDGSKKKISNDSWFSYKKEESL